MHPAAQRVLERVHGVEWRYMQFDYATLMGVCGVTSSGRRWACRFNLSVNRKMPNGKSPKLFPNDYLAAYADKVEQAKEIVMKRLFSNERCIEGDECMEGNETQI